MKHLLLAFALAFSMTFGISQSQEIVEEESFTPIDIGYQDFRLVSPLVKVIRTEMTSPKFLEEGLKKCNDWILNGFELEKVLKSMAEESIMVVSSICDFYPCYYTGTISNGETEYEITIYGGSFISINKPSTKFDENVTYFLTSEDSPLFISPCWCEKWEQD